MARSRCVRRLRAYLHAQLVVKVAEAQHLRPEALVAGQRVHASSGAHGVELRTERRVTRDVRSVRRTCGRGRPNVSAASASRKKRRVGGETARRARGFANAPVFERKGLQAALELRQPLHHVRLRRLRRRRAHAAVVRLRRSARQQERLLCCALIARLRRLRRLDAGDARLAAHGAASARAAQRGGGAGACEMMGTTTLRAPVPLLYRAALAGDAQEQQLGARAASPAAAYPAGLSARPRALGTCASRLRRTARRVAWPWASSTSSSASQRPLRAMRRAAACARRDAPRPCALRCFRRRETPQEQVRRWQRVLRNEMRAMDRQITGATLQRDASLQRSGALDSPRSLVCVVSGAAELCARCAQTSGARRRRARRACARC